MRIRNTFSLFEILQGHAPSILSVPIRNNVRWTAAVGNLGAVSTLTLATAASSIEEKCNL